MQEDGTAPEPANEHRGRPGAGRAGAGGPAGVVAIVITAVVLVAGISAVVIRSRTVADETRRAGVDARGATVMGFDQTLTTHRFDGRADGGVETVVATDASQVALVRRHLADEQPKFASGDFSDPIAIHGPGMPGVDVLADAGRRGTLTVTYDDVPDGGRLTYRSADPAVVDALHRWFDAQLADHGTHATAG